MQKDMPKKVNSEAHLEDGRLPVWSERWRSVSVGEENLSIGEENLSMFGENWKEVGDNSDPWRACVVTDVW